MKEKIKRILGSRDKKCILNPKLITSAVLVPIYKKKSEYYILFTKRTARVEYHKGEISFPGGKRDKKDSDLLATALREAFEEIALRPEVVEILGKLDDESTVSTNFVLSPFVGFIPYPYDFKINHKEVEKLIEVPIAAVQDKANFRQEIITDKGRVFPTYFYYYSDYVIWGATARILKSFLDLL